MNWKKLLLIAVVAAGLSFVAAPQAEAHPRVSVGIGIGAPVGFGFGYGGYYAPAYYPYGYGYPYGYYAPVRVVVRPHYHWYNHRRVYCRRAHRGWR